MYDLNTWLHSHYLYQQFHWPTLTKSTSASQSSKFPQISSLLYFKPLLLLYYYFIFSQILLFPNQIQNHKSFPTTYPTSPISPLVLFLASSSSSSSSSLFNHLPWRTELEYFRGFFSFFFIKRVRVEDGCSCHWFLPSSILSSSTAI